MINLIESLVIASQLATVAFPKYDLGSTVFSPLAIVDQAPSSFNALHNDSPFGCYSLGLQDKEAVKTRTEQIFERLAGEEVSRLYPASVSEKTGVNTRFYLSMVTENFVIDPNNAEASLGTFKKDMSNENRQARNPQSILLVGHVDRNEMRSALGNLPLDQNYDAVSLAPRILQTQFSQRIPAAMVVDKTGSIVAVCGNQETASAINAGTFIFNFKDHPTFQGKEVLETDFVLKNKKISHIIPVQRGETIFGVQKKADGEGRIIAFLNVEDPNKPVWTEWPIIGSQPAKAIADSKEEVQPQESQELEQGFMENFHFGQQEAILGLAGGVAGLTGVVLWLIHIPKRKKPTPIKIPEEDFQTQCKRQQRFEREVVEPILQDARSHGGHTTGEIARAIDTGIPMENKKIVD